MTPEQVAAAIRADERAAQAAAVTVAGLTGDARWQAAHDALVAGVGAVRAQLLVQKARAGEFGPVADGLDAVPLDVAVSAARLGHRMRRAGGTPTMTRWACERCQDAVTKREASISGPALDRQCVTSSS